ncbi:MAG: thiolase family protein [Candidatus Latescibacterota bacterium]|nr:MAG: thiolase family protein [Candidatus Latescibacterota bacterium]
MKKIKIKSSYLTPFGRLDHDLVSIALEAVRGVLSDVDIKRVRHVYIASYAPAELCRLPNPFGQIRRAFQKEYPGLTTRYHGLFKTGGEALHTALEEMRATASNDPGHVLIVGVEKMTHLPPAETAGILSQRENPHDRAYGATLPALGALATRSYLRTHGIPETPLHSVAVKNHKNGSQNPKAHFRRPVTLDDVASSPLVADPLRRLHCAPTSDGAAALLLDTLEGEVWYRGWGKGTDTPLFQDRDDIGRFAATAKASDVAWRQSHVTPEDIDVVEIHDAFTSFELINLEEMGFFEMGDAWKALEAGELEINGKLAVNSSGGMKAKGHPIGTTGISSSAEIHDQLTGKAGPRQHENARLGMVQSVGGVSDESFVFILDSC